MLVLKHSFRDTVKDEFEAVMDLSLSEPTRLLEQYDHYRSTLPYSLIEKPIWTGILLRRHHSQAVQKLCNLWFVHCLRYSRRDQLSLRYCLAVHPVKLLELELDNHKSDYHEWPIFPIVTNRKEYPRKYVHKLTYIDTKSFKNHNVIIDNLKSQMKEVRKENQKMTKLKNELTILKSSRSWKITKPFRTMGMILRTIIGKATD